ncbi:Cobalt-zinc-cadmium resistance protein CzcA [compost metagenome]
MATVAAAIGLLPASVATGIGSQAQKPLARVVVGGMLTAAVLILVVLPVLYQIVYRMRGDKGLSRGEEEEGTKERPLS